MVPTRKLKAHKTNLLAMPDTFGQNGDVLELGYPISSIDKTQFPNLKPIVKQPELDIGGHLDVRIELTKSIQIPDLSNTI